MPVAIDLLDVDATPLTLGFGIVLGYVAFSEVSRRRARNRHPQEVLSFRDLISHMSGSQRRVRQYTIPMILNAVGGTTFVIFAWAVVYLDAAIVSSLFEIWPMVWILSLGVVDHLRHEVPNRAKHPWSTYALMTLGVPALVLIVYSAPDPTEASGNISAVGVLLALVAPFATCMVVANIYLVDRVIYSGPRDPASGFACAVRDPTRLRQVKLGISHSFNVLARGALLPLLMLLAWREAGSWNFLLSWQVVGGALVGFWLNAPAANFVRRSTFLSERREIASLQYLSPILALLWLALLTDLAIGRIDFLVFGTVVVGALNMLINLDPDSRQSGETISTALGRRDDSQALTVVSERDPPDTSAAEEARRWNQAPVQHRYSLRALVVTLLGFGILVYYRDDIIPISDWTWIPGNYWAVLALASTVFALLLAFRLTRVETLLVAEDIRTLGIVRRVELLPGKYFGSNATKKRQELLDWIRLLNQANSVPHYRNAYNQVQKIVHGLGKTHLSSDYEIRREIAEIRTEIDALAHGRQHAREFAERIALWLIGSLIMAVAMSVPPERSPWASFLAEMFAILLGAVVVFLLTHLADMRRSRADQLLRERGDDWPLDLPDTLYVRFRDGADVIWQRLFSALVIIGIVATLAIMLGRAHLVL